MNFYDLKAPVYATDQLYSLNNPANGSSEQPALPALICPNCTLWASSDRLRVRLPDSEVLRRVIALDRVSIEEWPAVRASVARELNLPERLVTPGAEIGPPLAVATGAEFNDFLHPWYPRAIWVKTPVKEAIEALGASGVAFARVEFVGKVGDARQCSNFPEYWEIVVTGTAWRVGMDLPRITLCDVCGRLGFPDPGFLAIDEKRWDGSDFVNPDRNANITIITKRVYDVFRESEFTNWHAEPIRES